MEYFLGLVALAFASSFALQAFNRGPRWGAKSKLELVFTGLDAVVALLAVHLLMPWTSVSPLLWLIPVAVLAVAVYGSVLRGRQLATLRVDKPRRRTLAWAAVHAAVLVGILFVLLA